MEYTYDELLEITEKYLDNLDLLPYFPEEEINVKIVIQNIIENIKSGKFPPLPEALEGDLMKAFTEWDFICYFKKRYNLNYREEIISNYYISF